MDASYQTCYLNIEDKRAFNTELIQLTFRDELDKFLSEVRNDRAKQKKIMIEKIRAKDGNIVLNSLIDVYAYLNDFIQIDLSKETILNFLQRQVVVASGCLGREYHDGEWGEYDFLGRHAVLIFGVNNESEFLVYIHFSRSNKKREIDFFLSRVQKFLSKIKKRAVTSSSLSLHKIDTKTFRHKN